ncbi:hypothetical protein CFN78_02650 [Amycolatopsis antarctica]|uniref:Uncharacterized protein n=1 Tax=Amycolatopsis antarctica TaxID=1854586 RepID=A0A263D999_9PSEU|nr:hypothetical protein [Amycolatopsis antarctica]OZM75092.1 hypothetical protein CFN78_02650 [Amycolatopsis antarctica]
MTLDTATIPVALRADTGVLWDFHRPGAGPAGLAAHTAAVGEADAVIDALVDATPDDVPMAVLAAAERLRSGGYGARRLPPE